MTHDEHPAGPADGTPTAALPGHVVHGTAPRPTPRTVRRRTSLPLQAWRFVVVNLRMIAMIRRSHQH